MEEFKLTNITKSYDDLNDSIQALKLEFINLTKCLSSVNGIIKKVISNLFYPYQNLVEVNFFDWGVKVISPVKLSEQSITNCCNLCNIWRLQYTEYQTCRIYNFYTR